MIKILQSLAGITIFIFSIASHAEQKPTIDEIQKMAESGDVVAQAKYGAIYYLGGQYKPLPSARYKTRKQYEAITYLLEGVGKDDKKAAEWMLKAAEQGYVDAEVFMAAMYDRGLGVNQSESEATKWYKKAGDQGNEMAKAVLGPYARSRLTASKEVPEEYALKILNTK